MAEDIEEDDETFFKTFYEYGTGTR